MTAVVGHGYTVSATHCLLPCDGYASPATAVALIPCATEMAELIAPSTAKVAPADFTIAAGTPATKGVARYAANFTPPAAPFPTA